MVLTPFGFDTKLTATTLGLCQTLVSLALADTWVEVFLPRVRRAAP